MRHRSLRTVLPRHAGERNLPAAVAVRSSVPGSGAYREGCAADDRGSEAGVRDGGGVESAVVDEIAMFSTARKSKLYLVWPVRITRPSLCRISAIATPPTHASVITLPFLSLQ